MTFLLVAFFVALICLEKQCLGVFRGFFMFFFVAFSWPSFWANFTRTRPRTECTKIAHRRSLAIFTAEEGIAGNSAARTIFTHFLRRKNRGSLAIFFAEEIAHLGASKNRAIVWGAIKIAAAAAENRATLVHSTLEQSSDSGLHSGIEIFERD